MRTQGSPTPQGWVDWWNRNYPAGTDVRYWLPNQPGEHRGRTLGPAHIYLSEAHVVVTGDLLLPLTHVTAHIPSGGAA